MTTREGIAEIRPVDVAVERQVVPFRRGSWRDALRRRMLAVADLLAVLAAAGTTGMLEGSGAALWVSATAPLWIVAAKFRGLYDRDHARLRHVTLDESSGLFHWALLCGAGTALVLGALPGVSLSAGSALAMGGTAFTSVFAFRTVARALWRRAVPPERALIVGTGTLAKSVARRLALDSGHHVGIVATVALADAAPGRSASKPGVVSVEELQEIVGMGEIERVIVALRDLDEQTLSPIVSTCRGLGVKLSVAPPIRAMLGTAVELNHIAELALIEFHTWDVSRSTMLVKRLVDVVGSTIALIALAPWLAVIAIAIKWDSTGPVIFRQLRAGQNGQPFKMLKFRTMVSDAEARVGEVVAIDELVDPVFKVRSDPRVTRVGRILRRTSLDELPQLVNVLRGEMSLVGPRPEEAWLVERYAEADRFRLALRPGITGPMQVHGRGELTFQERVSLEREYVENYSLRKDFKILVQTLGAVIHGRGAF